MTTGTHAIQRSVLIDRELYCQLGITLREWAERHGVPLRVLVMAIDEGRGCETILGELAEDLGVSEIVCDVAAA